MVVGGDRVKDTVTIHEAITATDTTTGKEMGVVGGGDISHPREDGRSIRNRNASHAMSTVHVCVATSGPNTT